MVGVEEGPLTGFRSEVAARLDLSAYPEIIEGVRMNASAVRSRSMRESQRWEKRRRSLSWEQVGLQLTRRNVGDTILRFVLSEPGAERPGGRGRRWPRTEMEHPAQERRGSRSKAPSLYRRSANR